MIWCNMLSIKHLLRRGAFGKDLSALMKPKLGVTAATVASKIGIQRVRLNQVLKGQTPPPDADVVGRLADLLSLEPDKRLWLQWLALRERADPQVMMLLRIYEEQLLKAWKTEDLEQIPRRLETQLREAFFVTTNKPIYIRDFTGPVEVLLHDENGAMQQSLVRDWIVPVEPVGMHKEKFFERAVDHVVLTNVGKQCRIGWLREGRAGKRKPSGAVMGGDFTLFDDSDGPLAVISPQVPPTGKQSARRGRGAVDGVKSSGAIGNVAAPPRCNADDVQALISMEVLKAIAAKRKEHAESTVKLLRQEVFEAIRRGPLALSGGNSTQAASDSDSTKSRA